MSDDDINVVLWGPEIEGADQVEPGVYVIRNVRSIFTLAKKQGMASGDDARVL